MIVKIRRRLLESDSSEAQRPHSLIGEEEALTPYAYALAHALTLEEWVAPLPVRAGWASFLRRVEPGPAQVREAVLEAHRQGHMRAGQLTPDGAVLALCVLSGAASPPPSIRGPHGGPGGET